MAKTAPYGSWTSPIGIDLITQNAIRIAELLVDQKTGEIYHVEGRPSEGGRNVLIDTVKGHDITPHGSNARTQVHEYGGAASLVYDGQAYFSDLSVQRVVQMEKGATVPVTPMNDNMRFCNFAPHPVLPNLLASVREDHTNDTPSTVANDLVIIDTSLQSVSLIVAGADFYSEPTFSPDGKHLAWVQWNHPDMPWEGSELHIAAVELVADGKDVRIGTSLHVAGEKENVSISQIKWLSNDKLVLLSDVSGFTNPWVYNLTDRTGKAVLASPLNEDIGEPAWSFGNSHYDLLSENEIIAVSVKNGVAQILLIDVSKGTSITLESPYCTIAALRTIPHKREFVIVGHQMNKSPAIVHVTLTSSNALEFNVLKETSTLHTLPEVQGSISESTSYTLSPPQSNNSVHVLFYAPKNKAYEAPKDEKPPCVVHIHGGPTAHVSPGLTWLTQYYTSRGWAWLDVNYGGSSGYGRQYRERLRGKWGIVDVDDTVDAVRQLADRGLVDPKRVVIRGGSSGGFTVLASLVNHPTVFAAGTSSYGISDLFKLATDSHKFESQYLGKLLGGTPEQVPEVYKERSPVFHAEKIKSPLLILQGSIDAVVPPNQAVAIVEKIKANGGKVEYILFEGEGHGWRKAENVKTALKKEQGFYEDVLGFKSVDA